MTPRCHITPPSVLLGFRCMEMGRSRSHFRVTFDDIARSVEFNAPYGAIKPMSVYCFFRNNASLISNLYQNPLLIIATAPDGVKMLMKCCTTSLYGSLTRFLSKMGRVGAVRGTKGAAMVVRIDAAGALWLCAYRSKETYAFGNFFAA